MNLYFKIKFIFEYVVPIIAIILVALCIVKVLICETKKIKKIDKYMEEHGYEYYLREVASCGDKEWYAYRKGNVKIDTDELYKMKFENVQQQFK